MSAIVLHGDCLEVLRTLEPESVDAVITDPPYGLGFMGKAWDHGVPGVPFWTEMLRVLKPGAHLVAFGGTRTYHRQTVAIEDAGFEIRDCLSWLYGSGFPKSKNGAWGGTALKPAWEPAVLARKPLIGTVEENFTAHGTGGLRIDAARLPVHEDDATPREPGAPREGAGSTNLSMKAGTAAPDEAGRWPPNVALDEAAAALLDAQTGVLVSGASGGTKTGGQGNVYGAFGQAEIHVYGDEGGASRFFYTAKASRSEREEGLAEFRRARVTDGRAVPTDNPFQRGATERANTHPTVKPVELMRWLVRLLVPPGALVVDPFCGSGTTLVACEHEFVRSIGIEKEAEYVPIIRARIAAALRLPLGAPA